MDDIDEMVLELLKLFGYDEFFEFECKLNDNDIDAILLFEEMRETVDDYLVGII